MEEKLNYGFGYNETNSIAIIWCIDDVRYQLKERFKVPMDSLTDEECMQVLRSADSNHDADIGLSWETINICIDYEFEDKIAELQKEKGNTNEKA
mgnify:FL=1